MTIGDMIEVLNDVPEGTSLDEWLSMPFVVEIGNRLIEIEEHHLDIDVMEAEDDEDSDEGEMSFIISPEALPPLDDEEEGVFTYPSINLN